MNPALWISKTGLAAQDRHMATISNNLANVNTVGFKRDRVSFEDLFYHIEKQPGALADQQNILPSGMQVGTGVRVTGTQKIFTTGNYQTTEQALDMAVVGNGFFQIAMPDGSQAYTRNGQFHMNAEGTIVTANGLPLEPGIQIPSDAVTVTVSEDGSVIASLPGVVETVDLGQIPLITFVNSAGLQAKGGNLFVETAASGAPVENLAGANGVGKIKQFTLEMSNVSAVEELVNMISVQRAYEMNSKVISAADQMMQFVNQALG
ncbi:MAG: flagellar basal-body rod protein FlgG [Oceanospirillales bacterium LUC14_002_19_P2]|nr:MAG: flagellar basal-body rod protein FlgG [Oceanospirillales bacterium LUC14_002_19_P2]